MFPLFFNSTSSKISGERICNSSFCAQCMWRLLQTQDRFMRSSQDLLNGEALIISNTKNKMHPKSIAVVGANLHH